MFNIRQASFKSAQLLNEMALVQSQRNSTVAGRFYAPFPRISCKTFLESLKQTRSSCKGLIYWRNNFFEILLRPLGC